MDGTFSYIKIFKHIANYYMPHHILEWGPGKSTQLMLELFSDSQILTIEHNRKYYDRACQLFNNNDKIRLIYAPMEPTQSQGYVTIPLENNMRSIPKYYDFIFVDGRERHSCLIISKLISNGIVIIHDAQRDVYKSVYSLYKYQYDSIEYGVQTTVLSDYIDINTWFD